MSNKYEGLGEALIDMNLHIARLEIIAVAVLKELAEAKSLSQDFTGFLERIASDKASTSTEAYLQQLPALMAEWTQMVRRIQGS